MKLVTSRVYVSDVNHECPRNEIGEKMLQSIQLTVTFDLQSCGDFSRFLDEKGNLITDFRSIIALKMLTKEFFI
jgi:hypothetical protein